MEAILVLGCGDTEKTGGRAVGSLLLVNVMVFTSGKCEGVLYHVSSHFLHTF